MAGYFGDKKTMVVHHLANTKKECNLYYVEKKDREYFTPDSLETATSLGFHPCKYCI